MGLLSYERVKGLGFYPASPATFAVFLSILKLIEDGIVDDHGKILLFLITFLCSTKSKTRLNNYLLT